MTRIRYNKIWSYPKMLLFIVIFYFLLKVLGDDSLKKVLGDDSLKNQRYYLRDRDSGVEFFLHLFGDCRIHFNHSLVNELDRICSKYGKECLEQLSVRTSLLPLFSFDVLTPGPAVIGRKTSQNYVFLQPERHPIGIDLKVIHARITDRNEARLRLVLVIVWEDNRVCTPLKDWSFALMDSRMTDKISTPNIDFLSTAIKLSGSININSQIYTDETISTRSGHRLFSSDKTKVLISKPTKITLEQEWIVNVPCEPIGSDYPFEKISCPLTLYNSVEFTCLYLLNMPNLSNVDISDWTMSLLSIRSTQNQYFMYSRTPTLYFKFKFMRTPVLSCEIWIKSMIGLIVSSGSYLFRHFLSVSCRLFHLLFGIFIIISLQASYSQSSANKFFTLSLFDVWMRTKPRTYTTQARLNRANEEIIRERQNIIFDSISYIIFSILIVLCLFSIIFLYVKSKHTDSDFKDKISRRKLYDCKNKTSGFGQDSKIFKNEEFFLTKDDLSDLTPYMYDVDKLEVKPNEFECRSWADAFQDYVHYYLNNRECFQKESGTKYESYDIRENITDSQFVISNKMVITTPNTTSYFEDDSKLNIRNFPKSLWPVVERLKSLSQKFMDLNLEKQYLSAALENSEKDNE